MLKWPSRAATELHSFLKPAGSFQGSSHSLTNMPMYSLPCTLYQKVQRCILRSILPFSHCGLWPLKKSIHVLCSIPRLRASSYKPRNTPSSLVLFTSPPLCISHARHILGAQLDGRRNTATHPIPSLLPYVSGPICHLKTRSILEIGMVSALYTFLM